MTFRSTRKKVPMVQSQKLGGRRFRGVIASPWNSVSEYEAWRDIAKLPCSRIWFHRFIPSLRPLVAERLTDANITPQRLSRSTGVRLFDIPTHLA